MIRFASLLIILLMIVPARAGVDLDLLPLPLKVEQTGAARVAPKGHRLADDPSLGEEGYILDTTGGEVVITGGGRAGHFYAQQTLTQLGGTTLPQVRITDRPRFAYRGLLLDSARHIQSIEFLKKTIDRLARY